MLGLSYDRVNTKKFVIFYSAHMVDLSTVLLIFSTVLHYATKGVALQYILYSDLHPQSKCYLLNICFDS